jgi:group I intron endonuclease
MIGVYAILHHPTGKSYIGGSTNIERRIYDHINKLKKKKHVCIKFQKAWNKTNTRDWIVIVLESCTKGILRNHEQLWMDKMDAYNKYVSPLKKPEIKKNIFC